MASSTHASAGCLLDVIGEIVPFPSHGFLQRLDVVGGEEYGNCK